MTAVLVLAAVAAGLLLPLGVSAVRHREVARLAARNVTRRRTEAALVVAGSLLGTAIITSAFVVGDVVDGSIADVARTQLGPVDVTVTPADGDLDAVAAAVAAAAPADVDGTLPVRRTTAALELPAGGGQAARAVPRAGIVELDLAAARAFGDDPASTGLDLVAGDLGHNEVVLNERTAERLAARPGDRIRLHAYGTATELTLTQVVPEVGLAGYGGALVAAGTLEALAGAGDLDAAPPQAQLLVSLAGGVFDTRDASPAAVAALRDATAGLEGVEVDAVKATLLDDAERQGASLAELFTTIGSFSVMAGILLLVNLFVMLAEERKTELGMLRALGFTRRRLSGAFAFEGALYAVTAAAAGTVLGVGIGWVVARTAGAIFGIGDQGIVFRLVVEPTSLALGGLLGLTMSLITIWLTSLRIGRLNVIRAIRDLPEPSRSTVSLRRLIGAGLGVLAGIAVSVVGVGQEQPIPLLVGVPVAAFAAGPLLRRVLPERPARLLSAGTALAWGVGAFPLFGDVMSVAELPVFVVQGVVLTAAAVSLVATLDAVWARVLGRVAPRGGRLAVRLGMAYPLARRVRTSLLLGMFSLVIFTMTFIASLSAAFDGQRTDLTAAARGGFDVVLDANPANPATTEALLARDDVADAAALRRGHAMFEAAGLDGPRPWTITGFDEDLVTGGAPELASRADGYADDRAVWDAVASDPSLAIVPDGFLGDGGPQASRVGVGDTFEVLDPAGGAPRTLTVAAVGSPDFAWNGALVSSQVTGALFGAQDVPSRHYLVAADGTGSETLASRLGADLLANGAEATSFTTMVDEAMRQENAFLTLLQGFLGLGLLVGIAGLGVVMIRAVRERRQQVGMLRALGFSTTLVRRAFLTEAGLIATQGTAIGAALGLVTVRQVLTSSQAFGDGTIGFTVPWAGLAVVAALPLAASLVATAWPAIRAARITPAVALRVGD
ncbi:ABC transporter permease [Egicoccus sp. AB-alg2]|uniref:ABC transporter permease n=1 Tax=Egicoccus sp. AB-alg2 TaxID=3242693 RepID=UPI00359EA41E